MKILCKQIEIGKGQGEN